MRSQTPRKPKRTVRVHSAGGFVLRQEAGQPQLLLIKNNHGRKLWSLPKGHIERGEAPEAAAIREIKEETGIRSRILEKLGELKYSFEYGNRLFRKTVDVYLLIATGDTKLYPEKFDPEEGLVEDAQWFDLDQAVQKNDYKNAHQLLRLAVERTKEHYGQTV